MISTTEYKDMYKKFCFHKEQIIQSLLKQGIYPEEDIISNAINDIDSRLALFKQYVFMPGEKVNVKELNYSLEMIHKDLEFLYEIIIDIYNNEYSKLTTYIESHLNYLESLVDKYEKRAIEETNSTTFGETLLFESNSLDIETNDDQTIVNLGELDLISGTTIACFANINNTESKNIAYSFETEDSDYNFNTLIYNYNNSKAIVPGELSVKTIDLELNKDFNITDSVRINMNDININSDYQIMGGKGYILVKNLETMKDYLYEMPTFETTLSIEFKAHISFYLIDGNEFEYMFNIRPTHTNFSLNNSKVQIMNKDNYVFMETPENFTFGISLTKGNIYAVKENGVIKDNALYYYGNKDIKTLQIREYIKDNPIKYNVKVTIESNDISHLDIDSLYIKELS